MTERTEPASQPPPERQPGIFRVAGPAEAELISDVALRSYRAHYLHLWHDAGAWYMQQSFAPAVLAADMAHPNHHYVVVYHDGQPAGFLKLNLLQPIPNVVQAVGAVSATGTPAGTTLPANATPFDAANALELERIYLVPEATGRGVGGAALHYVRAVAQQLGRQTIWLKAMDSSHDALAFYERNGFRRFGTHRLTYPQMKAEYRGMVLLGQAVGY